MKSKNSYHTHLSQYHIRFLLIHIRMFLYLLVLLIGCYFVCFQPMVVLQMKYQPLEERYLEQVGIFKDKDIKKSCLTLCCN